MRGPWRSKLAGGARFWAIRHAECQLWGVGISAYESWRGVGDSNRHCCTCFRCSYLCQGMAWCELPGEGRVARFQAWV